MIHYDMADWVDYLRGLGEPGGRAEMNEHLRGCVTCQDTLARLTALALRVEADEAFEPPPSAVRRARAVFTQFQPERVCDLPRLLARLVQDSFREPLLAGIRGNERASRQALYEAGRVVVDLRLEQRPGQSAVVLVGQLLYPDEPRALVAKRPIVITSGRQVLGTTASNEHGEFHLEYEPAGQVRLHIPVEEGTRRVEIALNRLMPRSASRGRARAARDNAHDAPTTSSEKKGT